MDNSSGVGVLDKAALVLSALESGPATLAGLVAGTGLASPTAHRIAVALVILGGLVGSSLIGVLASKGPHLLGLHLVSVVGFVLSGVFGVWLLWGVFRSGRL